LETIAGLLGTVPIFGRETSTNDGQPAALAEAETGCIVGG